MTFGKITNEGIRLLSKLESLTMLSCSSVTTFRGFQELTSLKKFSISYGNILDDDLFYLGHVEKVSLLRVMQLNGESLRHLVKVKQLSLHYLTFGESHMRAVCTLPHLPELNVYDCRTPPGTKSYLMERLPGIFHTDIKV
jgi:hypothetical protein